MTKATRIKVVVIAAILMVGVYLYSHPISFRWPSIDLDDPSSSSPSNTNQGLARQLAAGSINDTEIYHKRKSRHDDGGEVDQVHIGNGAEYEYEGEGNENQKQENGGGGKPVESKLLVLVLAGGDRMRYRMHRAVWRMIAGMVENLGVHIYLVAVNPQVPKEVYNAELRTLVFPGADGNIPGCLEATIKGIDYVFTHKLPGHDAPHLLRTNMSSFFVFKLLLEWLSMRPTSHYYASIRLHDHNVDYASGAGMIISRDMVVTMMEKRKTLDWSEWDDIAIGKFMIIDHNITLTHMPRCDMYVQAPIELAMQPPLYCNRGPEYGMDFHYRVKSPRPMQDMYVFSMLFMHHYGPSQFVLPQSAFFYSPVTPNTEEQQQLQAGNR